MGTGEATIKLPYPDIHRYGWKRGWHIENGRVERGGLYCDRNTPRESPSHWRKLIQTCRRLKATRVAYEVEYIFTDSGAEAHIAWVSRVQ